MISLADLHQYTESPIERAFAIALASAFKESSNHACNMQVIEPQPFISYSRDFPEGCFIIPQSVVEWFGSSGDDCGEYRVDFLMCCGFGHLNRQFFAIECDGQEWHASSAEQVARDKLRDRRLLTRQISTIRFTGAEIFRDAAACATCVLDIAESAYMDRWEDQRRRDHLSELCPPKPIDRSQAPACRIYGRSK